MQASTREQWNDLESLLALIESAWITDQCPITIMSRNFDSDTPLHTVITWGDIDAVSLLLREGADINAGGEDGNTPLHHAIMMGEFEIAQILLARGADKELRNNEGAHAEELCWKGEWTNLLGEPESNA